MPKLTLYSFWIPDQNPPTILIAGDKELHSLFMQAFPDRKVQSSTWKPKQPSYNFAFYVNDATERDRQRFETWLDKYKVVEPILLSKYPLVKVYALSHHEGPISDLVKRAKYHTDLSLQERKQAAEELVRIVEQYLDYFEPADYFVSVPYLDKQFDLPTFITDSLCQTKGLLNGSGYVTQTREKRHSQKNLELIEEKIDNVKGLFKVEENHPFSGKVVTIVDDIYRSGTTISELAEVLRKAGARSVQALTLTKTFRD